MLLINRLFILSVSFILLAGCIGSEEIDDLGFVMAVGVDEREDDGKVLVTVQIVRPADSSGLSGGGRWRHWGAYLVSGW
ncbi:MAG: hypothetical protein LRY71_03355 [Bacillaceae bacterium]|nr:hypothetical protein [Bacillaceae bacterium]